MFNITTQTIGTVTLIATALSIFFFVRMIVFIFSPGADIPGSPNRKKAFNSLFTMLATLISAITGFVIYLKRTDVSFSLLGGIACAIAFVYCIIKYSQHISEHEAWKNTVSWKQDRAHMSWLDKMAIKNGWLATVYCSASICLFIATGYGY